ncbi:hypothetical protein QYE76_008927 [Lolium multiflorum]|uniref:Reverse transcriptase domain-containing protein n=1 Tax=Lolium multiflorum TaxID=4521 RepID=A0AAD8TR01_LOLMU|nr:hypothetical protein QYE76_008927 [Lolium multiflorum]
MLGRLRVPHPEPGSPPISAAPSEASHVHQAVAAVGLSDCKRMRWRTGARGGSRSVDGHGVRAVVAESIDVRGLLVRGQGLRACVGPGRPGSLAVEGALSTHRLKRNEGWASSHADKAQIIDEHFSGVLGAPPPRSLDFNWEILDPSVEDLVALGLPFSEVEIHQTILSLPPDKAPGPDGFTFEFFRACWPIVKHDLMKVIDAFSELSINNLHIINGANIALLPKKEGADSVTDFRPISLIHIVPKIISKTMAMRLQPRMNDIISPSQSAFIKSRSIHDNFMFIRNATRRLHQKLHPALLIKLDIAKAFDSVLWDYILDLLQRRGFPNRFRSWVALLFSSATSRVLLNGISGSTIIHGRGLRQGDPLPPLLFDLAMDP